MTPMHANAGLIAAYAGGALVAAAGVLYSRLKDADRLAAALTCLRKDVGEYLNAAEVVLADPDTPSAIRRMLFLALQTARSPELAYEFTTFLSSEASEAIDDDHYGEHPIDKGFRELQMSRPDLAERAQEAAFGLLFCAPIMHADRVRVDVVREGAVRPNHVWAKLGAALASLWPEQPLGIAR